MTRNEFDDFESVRLENKLCENLDSNQIDIYEKIKEDHYMYGFSFAVLEKNYSETLKVLFDIHRQVEKILDKEVMEK